MPISISPATAPSSAAVTLSNTLGYPVRFTVTLASCKGVAAYTSAPMTLPTGDQWTVPAGDPKARLVTFTVARADAAKGGIQTQVQLTSRQDCPATATVTAQKPIAAKHAVAGVHVPKAPSSGSDFIIGGVALIIVLVAVLGLVRRLRKPVTRKVGAHRG